jgi:hypothetical protein
MVNHLGGARTARAGRLTLCPLAQVSASGLISVKVAKRGMLMITEVASAVLRWRRR